MLPAAYRQLALLGQAGSSRAVRGAVEQVEGAVDALQSRVTVLQGTIEGAAGEGSLDLRARALADRVVPAMAGVREISDRIEELVADEFWTLPKYREMLFLV